MAPHCFEYLIGMAQSKRLVAAVICASAVFATDAPQAVLTEFAAALERRFIPAELSTGSQVAGIIALGGGFERTREAVRLSGEFPRARLVITGASEQDYDFVRTAQGRSSRVIIEPNARTTFENAQFTSRLVKPQPGERWLLVTSVAHMPRAVATFSNAGFAVEPWPVSDTPANRGAAATIASHELLGLIGYRILGRTAQLWPSPKS